MARERNERLFQWRKARRWTQAEAADKLGIKRDYYASIESGGTGISKAVSEKLDAVGFNEPDPITQDSHLLGIRRVSQTFGELVEVTPINQPLPVLMPLNLKRMGAVHFVIDDEAMMPILQPGDMATFKEVAKPVSNLTYLVKLDDSKYLVGNLEWKNSEWTLTFLNPNFRDMVVSRTQIESVMVNYYREINRREVSELNPDGLLIEMPKI